jgi:hypothetical protein
MGQNGALVGPVCVCRVTIDKQPDKPGSLSPPVTATQEDNDTHVVGAIYR